jgi:general secretion pathway protein F
MPIFQYKGYRADGSRMAGSIEATSRSEAVLRLKDAGCYLKVLNESSSGKKRWVLAGRDNSLLPSTTRQLATLLGAGVTLMDALTSIAEENSGYWRSVLVEIKERVAGGSGFSKAMQDYPDIFPEFYIHMTAAGEASGTLDRVLLKLAGYLESESALRSKVRVSMIYPVFMICVSFVVLAFLFAFVIPKITRIFGDTQSALPFITVALIWISDIFQRFWWLLSGALIAGIWGVRRIKEKKRILFDTIILRLPGNIVQSLYYGRFARNFSVLLEGGLPVLRALELSAKSTGNALLAARIAEAGKRVAEGARLSATLDGFPPVFLQLIATGEKSGRLAEVLATAASSYEEEFSRRVQKGLSILEPAMILVMGLFVGLIVLAVLLPIFQLNQLIK